MGGSSAAALRIVDDALVDALPLLLLWMSAPGTDLTRGSQSTSAQSFDNHASSETYRNHGYRQVHQRRAFLRNIDEKLQSSESTDFFFSRNSCIHPEAAGRVRGRCGGA